MNIIFLIILIIGISIYGPFELLSKLLFFVLVVANIFHYFVANKFKIKYNVGIKWWVIALLLWLLLRTENIDGLIQYCKFLFLMIALSLTFHFKGFNKIYLFFLLLIISALSVFTYLGIGVQYVNPNIGGLISLIVFFLSYVYFVKYRGLIFLLGFIVILLSGARSVLLSFIISGFVVYLVSRKSKFINIFIFLFTILLAYGLFIVWDFLMSEEFDLFVLQYTGKNFQSGRFLIWNNILSQMNGIDWIIGKGCGYNYSQYMPEHFVNLSLHSSYIYFIVHYGIIGVLLLFKLFYKCFKFLCINEYYYSAILFLFFIVRDFFEVTIINNQMAIAFLFWAFIANGYIEQFCPKIKHNITRFIKQHEKNNNSLSVQNRL